jgi:hypothetical protein
LKAPNTDPEQLQIKPTLIGAAVVWADDGLPDGVLPAGGFDEAGLLLDEHAARASAIATAAPTADQRLPLRVTTLDLLQLDAQRRGLTTAKLEDTTPKQSAVPR